MIECEGNLWEIAAAEGAAAVITTNGSVRRDGCAVMGRGCALEAKRKFPGIDRVLGNAITVGGNRVRKIHDADLTTKPPTIIAFPVKRIWNASAELAIISRSCLELLDLLQPHPAFKPIRRVVVPRPGCGNGRLRWSDVKPVLEALLPGDRFIVVHRPGEAE